ncbi:MAG TPA: ketoacyl-ACP synthase III [Pyrinomonadaceae bacterium]|nr:ketoacyl-ACP synthase III [Pyrinomonadaceae bacterium]
MRFRTVITGTGTILPDLVVPNSHFEFNEFYDRNGKPMDKSGKEIVEKLESIAGIRERRYIPFEQDSVQLMTKASRLALDDAGLSANDLSGIILAHNAGNMVPDSGAFHTVPNLAAVLKHELGSTNHNCFAYDLLFGCPGWLQGIIQAHQTIMSGDAEHVMVTGLEVASRLLDPHDPDSMILADGCGSCIVSRSSSVPDKGVEAYSTFSHALDDNRIIYLGPSLNPSVEGVCYFHMNGRAVYKYATEWVPRVIKSAIEKARVQIQDIDIFLLHQANAKMLEAIAANLASIFDVSRDVVLKKVPSTIEFLGNTSVATIPTMLDMIRKKDLSGFEIKDGDLAVMASVGAGMHCNSVVYQF